MKTRLFHAFFWTLLPAGLLFSSVFSQAEALCPGRAQGLHPRLVAHALLVVPVKINQAGPFDFMLDTGSQLNVIDPELAAQLAVEPQAQVGLVTTSSVLPASVVALDSIEAGALRVAKPLAAVHDLGSIQAADPRIRGVLGENFLSHFDMLIDYPRGLVCLDNANLMEKEIRGERIPLRISNHVDNDLPFSKPLVISVDLSQTARPLLLQIDSGIDGSILYHESLLRQVKIQAPATTDMFTRFAILPPQDIKLGARTIRNVSFAAPAGVSSNLSDRKEDGILATVLFERVYINHADQYIVFDPK